MKYASPLRYPGGKGCLAKLLADVVDLNDLRGCAYYEPYAGGAGAALELLRTNVVSEVHINDADRRVGAFWEAALDRSEQFVEQIFRVPLNIDEWRRQRDVCANPASNSRFAVGFAAFYMNRCNRSGVLTGAGPIGGLEQSGKWRLDVRFNREALAERILFLRRLRDRIHLKNCDALDFLRSTLPRGTKRSQLLVYLDPPYVNKGKRLYLNSYESKDHGKLATYISNQKTLPWIMSYDDTNLVRKLYSNFEIRPLSIRYSLQEKRDASELLISPDYLSLPSIFNSKAQTTKRTPQKNE